MVQVEGTNAGEVWVADGYVPVLMSISKVLCVQVSVISCLVCVVVMKSVSVCLSVMSFLSRSLSLVVNCQSGLPGSMVALRWPSPLYVFQAHLTCAGSKT